MPEIARDKRNSHPALGVNNEDGRIEILAGLRRSKAVSFIEEGEFVILVCQEMTDEEKLHFAQTSDIYEEPSAIDLGFTIQELMANKKANGEKLSQQQAGELFGVAEGKVSEVLSFAALPTELFTLYPSLSAIGYKFLRSLSANFKNNKFAVNEAIKKSHAKKHAIEAKPGDDPKELLKKSQELSKNILALINKSKASKPTTKAKSIWHDTVTKQGVKVTELKSGKIKISIDESKLNDQLSQQLLKLLAIPT